MPTEATTHIKRSRRVPDGERDGDTGDVPSADPRRKADAECLKGRDPTVLAVDLRKLRNMRPSSRIWMKQVRNVK